MSTKVPEPTARNFRPRAIKASMNGPPLDRPMAPGTGTSALLILDDIDRAQAVHRKKVVSHRGIDLLAYSSTSSPKKARGIFPRCALGVMAWLQDFLGSWVVFQNGQFVFFDHNPALSVSNKSSIASFSRSWQKRQCRIPIS